MNAQPSVQEGSIQLNDDNQQNMSVSIRLAQIEFEREICYFPHIVGQDGTIYRIFGKIGSGSYGAVYDAKIVP